MMEIRCEFWRGKRDFGVCSMGFYGGRPSLGVCQQCISKGENNRAFAEALFAREKQAHPDGVRRISGCCDRADQD